MMCSLARLEPKNLKTIQSLEKELRKPLLAFSCHDVSAAELQNDQLARIRKLETELNVYLDRRRNPHPKGGVMWDWLRRSRMGRAEGRFIAINIKTCLQQRRKRGDVGRDLVR